MSQASKMTIEKEIGDIIADALINNQIKETHILL